MSQLVAKEVTKNFRGLCAVNKVSLSVKQGEIFVIIGPNGAGKTTLLNQISRLLPLDGGELYFENKNISKLKPYQVANMGITRTFQVDKPFPGMTAEENVMVGSYFGCSEKGMHLRECRRLAAEILDSIGLGSKKAVPVNALSLAERRLLEVARALVMRPKIILLDEVNAGLDRAEVREMMKKIKEVNQKNQVTVVMVEHIMEAVMGLADRIMVMHYGQVIACDTPDLIARDERVIKAYLGTRFKGSKDTAERVK